MYTAREALAISKANKKMPSLSEKVGNAIEEAIREGYTGVEISGSVISGDDIKILKRMGYKVSCCHPVVGYYYTVSWKESMFKRVVGYLGY